MGWCSSAAGLYNLSWGVFSAIYPQWLYRLAGMPLLNHPEVFACLGMVLGLWTLDLVAEVCHGKAWTPRQLTGEAIRAALKCLGSRWRRAQRWITSPDSAYARKKSP
jgi:hypothetical protein